MPAGRSRLRLPSGLSMMPINKLLPTLGVCWALVAMAGPASAQPTGPQYLGSARPKGVPQRVVSLAPSLTEILFALDVGSRVIGVTHFDDYPPPVRKLTRVGGFVNPSLEKILSLRPDLVVCVPGPGGKTKLVALSRMGIPVLVLPSYGLEDIFLSVKKLGTVMAKDDAAAGLCQSMRARIKRVAARVKGLARPRVLLVYGHRPMVAAGKGSFAHAMLQLAGGENVLAESSIRYPIVPIEAVIRFRPQIIIDASSSGTGAAMSRSEIEAVWARWQVVPAVRTGAIHIFDSALWFRPGPRVVDGLESLAEILHPSGRSQADAKAKPSTQ